MSDGRLVKQRVLVVFGTRPEAIKLAPVITALRARGDLFETTVAVTAQHREMLDQVLSLFDIVPEYDLDIMTAGQTLTEITTRALTGLAPVMTAVRPDVVVVQGDTTTTFAAALSAFYHGARVAHVEAGLRTGDLSEPFPEEANRTLTTRLASYHFAPTEHTAACLRAEGVDAASIHVTGNTVVDALLATTAVDYEFPAGPVRDAIGSGRRVVVITAHRRENWGEPFRRICAAVQTIARGFPDVEVVFATHRNPTVRDVAVEMLGDEPRVTLVEPLPYLSFVKLLEASTLILSDSGGIQEEAPTLGKPALVMRDVTERPEAVHAGVVRLVGTDTSRIVEEASRLLRDADAYASMAKRANPFGDGRAAERIVEALLHT